MDLAAKGGANISLAGRMHNISFESPDTVKIDFYYHFSNKDVAVLLRHFMLDQSYPVIVFIVLLASDLNCKPL